MIVLKTKVIRATKKKVILFAFHHQRGETLLEEGQ